LVTIRNRTFLINKKSLKELTDLNDKIINEYGDILINNIYEHIKNNDIDIHKYHDIYNNSTNKEATKSYIISCELYNNGISPEEISNIRGLTESTIKEHLLLGYQDGIINNITKFIHTQYKDEINQAIRMHQSKGLKAIKENLPEEVTYLDIRYFMYQKEIEETNNQ
jgi:uncharacterized protein YpbB